MSSDIPAPAATGARSPLGVRLLIWFLLVVHAGWICVHLRLVSLDQINPWKLGGYGMYTVPNYMALTHVYLFDEATGQWAELPRSLNRFNSVLFDQANHLHVFRCRPPSAESLAAFMDENPQLRYRPLTIVLSEQRFSRAPIGVTREPFANLQIGWAGRETFAYRGEVCGTAFSGERAYTPPT